MKAIGIEALLVWTFCEQLPKREFLGLGLSNFSLVSHYAETLCERVDDGRTIGNRYHQLYGEGPHGDALIVEQAVKGLADVTPILHDEPARLVSDMPREVQEAIEDALDGYHVEPVALVISMATLRRRPDWRSVVPERVVWRPDSRRGGAPWFIRVPVKGPFGRKLYEERIAVVDKSTRRPPAGAYRKMVWQPELGLVVDGRLDWLVWLACLEALLESLNGRLTEHELAPLTLSERPWETGIEDSAPPARVLPALDLVTYEKAQSAPRPRALGRRRPPKAGPVRRVK